jgi:hypothetical protein
MGYDRWVSNKGNEAWDTSSGSRVCSQSVPLSNLVYQV